MRGRYTFVVALCALGLASNARGQSAAAMQFAERIAGCYALDSGAWRSASVAVGDVSTLRTPSRFELSAKLLAGWDGLQSKDNLMFAARSILSAGEVAEFTYWQRTTPGSGSVLISKPLPMGGVELILRPAGKDLVGTVTAFTDAVPPDGKSEISRPIRARRIDCP
jgi:hypothetical protein